MLKSQLAQVLICTNTTSTRNHSGNFLATPHLRPCDRTTSAGVHQVSEVSELILTWARVRDRWNTKVSTTNIYNKAKRALLTKLNIQLGANIMHPCGRVKNYQQQCGDQAEPRPEHGGMFQQHGATAQLTPSLFACSLSSWNIKRKG